MTKVLFIHNNFPGQFGHLAKALAKNPGVELAAIGAPSAQTLPGVKLVQYSFANQDVSSTHPFARRFDLECRRAEEVVYAASKLVSAGFRPDLILGHPGWGETLPLRSMFPESRIISYCELFYRAKDQDVGFDREFPEMGLDGDINVNLKNAATLLALSDCNAGLSPTLWQKSTYPKEYQDKIEVIHDGIDTDLIKPASNVSLELPSGRVLRPTDEVLTYVARGFEPLRGFHIVMRALPRILAERKNAQVVIVGGAGKPYGLHPPPGKTWRSIFFDEIANRVDQSRIHFVGHLSHANHIKVLQIARAHLYLSYPFVLSWSLLEAMAAGCLVIASDTAPVREVLDSSSGLLVGFHDIENLSNQVIEALAHPKRFHAQRNKARQIVCDRYDLKRVCLPKLLNFLDLSTAMGRRTAHRRLSVEPLLKPI